MKVMCFVTSSSLCLTAGIFRINLQFVALYLEIADTVCKNAVAIRNIETRN